MDYTWNSPGQNTGASSLSLLQGSSQPSDRTQVSCTVGGFFTSCATREALLSWKGRGVTVKQTEVWGSRTSSFSLVLSLGEFSYTSQPLRGTLVNQVPTRYLRNTQWGLLRARHWARKQDRRWKGHSPRPPGATGAKRQAPEHAITLQSENTNFKTTDMCVCLPSSHMPGTGWRYLISITAVNPHDKWFWWALSLQCRLGDSEAQRGRETCPRSYSQ